MAYTTINKPADYFNTVLWSGDNTARSITGVGHAPDWVWIKDRTGTNTHALFDSVRGINKYLSTTSTGAELDQPSSGYVSSFDSDGFSGVTGSSSYANWNGSGNNYVGWNWKAGGTASSNTDGDVTSSVSVNTTSGFSIVKWTAPGTSTAINVGHGLGVAPKVLITKCLGSGSSIIAWYVYHESLGNSKTIYLNGTDAAVTNTSIWGATTPTSTVFKHNSGGDNLDYVSYCFAEKKGFSKFGSYTGNGNADGTFVYTGFKPAFVMLKRTDTTNNWLMYDNKRNTFNSVNNYFRANLSDAEGSGTAGSEYIDFLSNGFKNITSLAGLNASGGSYIYMAFAENPLVTSSGVPATAR